VYTTRKRHAGTVYTTRRRLYRTVKHGGGLSPLKDRRRRLIAA